MCMRVIPNVMLPQRMVERPRSIPSKFEGTQGPKNGSVDHGCSTPFHHAVTHARAKEAIISP